eukprot:m.57091 g.57091  ORF g.57091 m.57091 type:complete len:251 (+) comp18838_c0_seq3:375-1127(+)
MPGAVQTPTACVVEDKGIYVSGMHQQAFRLYHLPLDLQAWIEIPGGGPAAPSNLTYFTMNAVLEKIFVLFGEQQDMDTKKQTCYCFDTNRQEWQLIKTKGKTPKGRGRHTTAVFEKSLVVFGGDIGHTSVVPTNNLHVLHCDSLTWKTAPVLDASKPSPRCLLDSCVTSKGHLCIFAGYSGSSGRLDDLYILPLAFRWSFTHRHQFWTMNASRKFLIALFCSASAKQLFLPPELWWEVLHFLTWKDFEPV